MATTSELLAEVDTAIEAILQKGQSYTINGRTFTRANLGELRRFRQELRAQDATDSSGGIRVRYGVPRG